MSLKCDICISQANYVPAQELTDGIARAEARLDVLDEAIEDAKDNLNTFLHKHGVAKSAIYCYGHFGKIGEIKDLEELEVSRSLRSTKLLLTSTATALRHLNGTLSQVHSTISCHS